MADGRGVVDYMDIVKRAWEITWTHKILWVFGFFAGAASFGAGNGGSRGFNTGTNFGNRFGSAPAPVPYSFNGLWSAVQPRLALAIALAAVLFLIGLVFWVLSIAARGGIIYLGNEAAAGQPVHAGPGWSHGFGKWGRTFLIGFLLALPIWVVLIVALLPVILTAVAAIGHGGQFGSAFTTGLLGTCGLLVLAIVIIIPYALLVSVLYPLALRHGVLENAPSVASIGKAWRDLRGRFKDVAVTWLILFGFGLAYSIVVGILALAVFAPVFVLFLTGAWLPGVLFAMLGVFVLMLPGAVYATFYNSVWTVVFRRLAGIEAGPARQPAMAGAYAPPPPIAAPSPPAPPSPEPPAPPPDA